MCVCVVALGWFNGMSTLLVYLMQKYYMIWNNYSNFQKIILSNHGNFFFCASNTRVQTESLLQSLQQTTGSIAIRVNVNKTEYMRFKREGAISTLSGRALRLVDKFTYLGSNISSTESDVNIRLAKARITIGRLSIIWKSDLSDMIKQDLFQA